MPSDTVEVSTDQAQQLIRFGFALAELRGRVYFGLSDPGRLLNPQPAVRTWHMPPLGEERSPVELRTQVINTVQVLAAAVNLQCKGALTAEEARHPPSPLPTAVDQVISLANAVPEDPTSLDRRQPWNAFAESFYEWDAQIQDLLASAPFGASSAYQLGRGLGETSWSLDPSAKQGSSMSWGSLLGPARCIALTSLVVRLTPVAATADVSQCIKGALARWSERVTSKEFVGDDLSVVALRRQVALWRDLLLSGADPKSLVPATAPMRRVSVLFPAIRSMWPQALVGFVSSVLLGYAAYLMTTAHPSGIVTTILTALGIFGFTGASVSAKASTAANNLATHLRDAIAIDELVESATLVPRKAQGIQTSSSYRPGRIAAPLTLDSLSVVLSARAMPGDHSAQ
jgi:hypothetical protein